jgi:hypothetical protein
MSRDSSTSASANIPPPTWKSWFINLLCGGIFAPFTSLKKKAEEEAGFGEEARNSKRRKIVAAEEPRYKVKGMRLIFNHRNISSRDIIE